MQNILFYPEYKHPKGLSKVSGIFQYLMCFLIILFYCHPAPAKAQDDWAQKYNTLKQIIDKHYDEPPGSTSDLETFLYWIETKGNELKRAKHLLDEANRMYISHPDNQNYNQWVSKFFDLVEHAENSGDLTVWLACVRILRVDEDTSWGIPLWVINRFGRKIYLKAKENEFSTIDPVHYATCFLNLSLGLLESDWESVFGGSGFSLYRGRQLLDSILSSDGEGLVLPDFLNSTCDGRKMFVRWVDGEPAQTITYAFTNVDMIRDECKWWGLEEIWQNATDLMNEYYEDALCKIPPHRSKLGHKYFLQLAEEKDLEKSIKYNKGFYGKLYGKVEILIDGEREPAPGAKITVEDYDESWTATADENGKYKIEGAILHKDCSPFDISARYKGYVVDDTYDGPLTKPDNTARYRKDLLIKPGINYKWFGNLTVLQTKNSHCLDNVHKNLQLQQVRLKIRARHIDISQPIIAIDLGNLYVKGSVSGKYEYRAEEEEADDRHYKHVIETKDGMNTFPVTKDNLLHIQIISEKIMDKGAMEKMAEMAKKVAMGNYNEKEIEKITAQMENQMSDDRKSFPVRVIIAMTENWKGKVSTYDYIHETDNGRLVKHEEINGAVEMDLASPVMLEMKGTCTKSKNGEVTIHAKGFEQKNDPNCIQAVSSSTFTIKRIVIN